MDRTTTVCWPATNTPTFVLGDANGIASLESLQISLLGEADLTSCYIHYEPRFGAVEFDEVCFLEQPIVQVAKRPLVTTYDVSVSFRLGWNASTTVAVGGGTPSLKVLDEGQDLGLGLYQLNELAWQPSTDIELRWLNITDTQAPFGENDGTTYWFHRNEMVHHRIGVFHNNTDVLARDLPVNGTFLWTLSDGERSTSSSVNLTRSGLIGFNVSMSENVMYEDEGFLTVEAQGFVEHGFNSLRYDLVVDDVAPKLVLAPGMLENLASNELTNVAITVSINDDTDMPPKPLEMHAVFYRLGQPVAGTEKVFFLPLDEVVNEFTVYNGTVNFLPAEVELTRSDVLIVWFEASDRSGRELTGYGTRNAPMNVGLTWYAFEPVLTDLSATPFRPKVGENVSIYARIANNGLLAGDMDRDSPRRRGTHHGQRVGLLGHRRLGEFCVEHRSLESRPFGPQPRNRQPHASSSRAVGRYSNWRARQRRQQHGHAQPVSAVLARGRNGALCGPSATRSTRGSVSFGTHTTHRLPAPSTAQTL